jgi:hypothetical protein
LGLAQQVVGWAQWVVGWAQRVVGWALLEGVKLLAFHLWLAMERVQLE